MGLRKLVKKAVFTGHLFSYISVAVLLCGCGSSRVDRNFGLDDLSDPDTVVRIMAMKWAGDNKVSDAIPYLVDDLQNEDKAVRFYAIESLRRITGTDCDYDYKSSANRRAKAMECWQSFLETNGMESDEDQARQNK